MDSALTHSMGQAAFAGGLAYGDCDASDAVTAVGEEVAGWGLVGASPLRAEQDPLVAPEPQPEDLDQQPLTSGSVSGIRYVDF